MALADERPRPSTWSSVWRTLVGTVALVLLVDVAAKLYLARYTPNLGYWLVDQKWRLLERLDRPVDWLLLGDSSCNQGLDPALFEQRLHGTAVNLCTIGGLQAVGDAWMLERYLARHPGAVPHVVVMHAYDVWPRVHNALVIAHIPLALGSLLRLTPSLVIGPADVARYVAATAMPLYAERTSMAFVLSNPRQAFHALYRLEPTGFMRVETPNPDEVHAAIAEDIASVAENPPNVSDENLRALAALGARSDAHGIEIWITPSPIADVLYARREFRAAFDRMDGELRGAVARFPRVHVLGGAVPFPADQMDDADHVTGPDAARLTEDVIARICRAGGCPGSTE